MDKQEKNSWDGWDLEDLTGHFSILSADDEEELLGLPVQEPVPEETPIWEKIPQEPVSEEVSENTPREEPGSGDALQEEPGPSEERRAVRSRVEHGGLSLLRRLRHAPAEREPAGPSAAPEGAAPEDGQSALLPEEETAGWEPFLPAEPDGPQEESGAPEKEPAGEEAPDSAEAGIGPSPLSEEIRQAEEEEDLAALFAGPAEDLPIQGKEDRQEPAASAPRPKAVRGEAKPSTMADVVASTVDGVLKEGEKDRRRYRRRRIRTQKQQEKLHRSNSDRAADTEDFSAPEPSMVEATMRQKRLEKRLRKHAAIAAVLTLCCWTATVFCPAGLLQRYIPAALLAGVLAAGTPVLAAGVVRRQINCCTMAAVTGLVTLLDALLPIGGRWEVQPMTGVAALYVTLALWGEAWRCGALREGFRLVALGRPAYVVDLTAHGAVKQEGPSAGFYNRSTAEDSASRWQRLVLPVVLTASLVFAVLSAGSQRQWGSFFWCWSVILCAGAGMALPLVYSLPSYRLAKRMGVSGGALAGLYGARKLSFSREMLVWDQDLFPPGSIRMGKVAVIGEDRRKVASYAGSLARAYRCGWTPAFETFMQSERGTEEHLDHFHVHEEGGISASIHGETAVLGQPVLMRRMSVRLPKHLERKNALYLAVDGELVAIFPLEYRPADSVSWALYAMRRNRITPLLVTRDPNITPRNLKAMFGSDGGSVLLDLNERLNLSALRSGGDARPNALLYREGLAPYLEAVAGSCRLCRAVKWGNLISLLGCAAGTLLSFYLIFAGKMGMLSPIQLLIFTLLWALPVVLLSLNVDRL